MENQEFYQGAAGYCTDAQFTPEKRHSDTKSPAGDHFIVEELLDFPNDDAVVFDRKYDPLTGTSADSSAATAVDSCNSSFSGGEPHFSGDMGCQSFADAQFSNDLCVPYDDLAELEWLSNIVEESFSSDDLQKLQLISGMTGRAEGSSETREFNTDALTHNNNSIFHPEVTVPGKARSKRSRAAPCNWASRLLALSPTTTSNAALGPTSSDDHGAEISGTKKTTMKPKKKEGGGENLSLAHGPDSAGIGRKCLHCATDKTPQWRSGPMGPKTLCNACGVRYKSGRLVPEYRPAASPTFVLTKHSNSHRKVMELRRQKEAYRAHQLQPGHFLHHEGRLDFEGLDGDDYLIHQHIGPDYRQLI